MGKPKNTKTKKYKTWNDVKVGDVVCDVWYEHYQGQKGIWCSKNYSITGIQKLSGGVTFDADGLMFHVENSDMNTSVWGSNLRKLVASVKERDKMMDNLAKSMINQK